MGTIETQLLGHFFHPVLNFFHIGIMKFYGLRGLSSMIPIKIVYLFLYRQGDS